MPRPPKPPAGPRPVEALTHADTRRNIPTAEFQSIAQQMEEAAPIAPARYPRASPLPPGETRPRNPDLDPQIIWRGMRITLTQAQRAQLQETGEVELGDAQLVWRGKDTQDWSDLVVNAPPIYIQEKVHPKAIIDGLQKQSRERAAARAPAPDLFSDFNGLDDPEARLEFYQHDQHWTNRMILGDSLQVMASLAEREGLRGKVQCIYFDPPYGIKFNSNWQVSTQSRDVKDGKREDVSREPEQVKAFRDTWKDGIHSYLTYLRDRLTVARELLTESGSIFVQIGDENVHVARNILNEVFGSQNFCSQITVVKTASASAELLPGVCDYILWVAKDISVIKYRQIYSLKSVGGQGGGQYTRVQEADGTRRMLRSSEVQDISSLDQGSKVFRIDNFTSQRPPGNFPININGRLVAPSKGYWKTGEVGSERLVKSARLQLVGNTLSYIRFIDDFRVFPINNVWTDTGASGFGDDKVYVVQTASKIVERCLLMATDPGDLVLDPTCGSGTTATVAEQWGRRWITIDTSRVALALARTRIMASKYPYYLLADSRDGRAKEQAVSGKIQPDTPTHNDVRQGFVYERAPHVTLKSIANNAEIDVIWEEAQQTLEPLRARLNDLLGRTTPSSSPATPSSSRATPSSLRAEGEAIQESQATPSSPVAPASLRRQAAPRDDGAPWEEWQIPRDPDPAWPEQAKQTHAAWWKARIERQRLIDASIARKADIEFLYDRPYEDRARIRVAGPFTVESLSPHRVVPADEDDLFDLDPSPTPRRRGAAPVVDFATMVLENLRTAGVHQTQKADSIRFTSLTPWPGDYIGAEGRFLEGETERRAGILIGPEFGTLSRADLVTAAREASEARFDVLIACAFNYDAHATELTKLGPMPILKARMNPDLHMADDLKNTGKGNLFVVFGEPDVVVEPVPGQPDHVQIRILGVDVFDPQTGDIRSGDTKSIAAWFIDTDYNEESFYVRHAYFLGANDPYKSLKTALRAEIDEEAWATLYRDVSRPFERPAGGRVAVKVINHFGDEVMKVFSI
jgi:adenine-specific DNA-methyltransferase